MKDVARLRYEQHRLGAGKRGIDWLFTFETWMATWAASGRWSQRGRGRGRYVMARRGDAGPYSPSNVEIILHTRNVADGHRNKPRDAAAKALLKLGVGRGWTRRGNRFQVNFCHRYVGLYGTAAEAERVYLDLAAAKRSEIEAERAARRSLNSGFGELPPP